jgi:hypothetical protein
MKYSDAHHESCLQSGRLLIIDDDDVLLSALPWPIKRRMPYMNIDTADTPEEALRHVYSGTMMSSSATFGCREWMV